MREFIHMTWREIDALDRENTLVILPIASVEQHGPHLPVGTDYLILQGLLSGLIEREEDGFQSVVLPILPFGLNTEHHQFPGTVCVPRGQIDALLEAQADSFLRHGFRAFALVNAHGGNIDLVDSFIRSYRMKHPCDMTAFTYFRGGAYNGREDLFENPVGLDVHAGEFETSLMLYLCPKLVQMDAAPVLAECNLPVEALPPGWLTHEYSRTGIIGDASLATSEKGRAFYQLSCDWLQRQLNSFMSGRAV